MSNDIQPISFSIRPDTQTVQQTGEKSVFANHVDNLSFPKIHIQKLKKRRRYAENR